MKVRLLDLLDDHDFEPRLPPKVGYLIEDDLELRRLYKAMGGADSYLVQVAEKVIPLGVTDPDGIRYRQQVLADCLAQRAVIDKMYAIAVEGDEVRRKVYLSGLVFREPTAILHSSLRLLEPLVANLKQLRALADAHNAAFTSQGFGQFFAMIRAQLTDEYLRELDAHLAELNLPRGTLLSAQLTLGNKGRGYVLHVPPRRSFWDKLTGNHSGYGFEVDERDVAGGQALTELAGRVINDVANTVTQSCDHVRGFFARLRFELGFYRGCVNLHDLLAKAGVPTCFPEPTPLGTRSFACRDLRDVGLCLSTKRSVRGNDIDAQTICLIMVTGANEGGKSTFLRSVGAAQVMMQAGMFVTASSLRANVTNGVFTHFKREEDDTMTHGKFDEELDRMSTLADHIGGQSMLLCNESFASTNEREGSQIACGIIDAMLKRGVVVVFVTHMYDLAQGLYLRRQPTNLFLRAERRPDGTRTFGMQAAPPEPTSYGEDSFRREFGVDAVGAGDRLRLG